MSNFKFQTLPRQSTKSYDMREKAKNHYVRFGNDNQFPDHLIELYNNSSIHNTCINATVTAIIGEGLTSNRQELLNRANTQGETWNDILRKTASDLKVFGGFALEVIWSNDGSRIAEVYHIDFSYLRAKEKNEKGRIEGYFVSDEWAKGTYKVQLDDMPYLPVYNPETARYYPNQVLYYQPYRPGQNYYPLPDYVGALKVIDLDRNVDIFHNSNIENGLAPSLSITTFTNANDDEREVIEHMLRSQWGGPNNAGSLFYMDVDSPENAPKIEPIAQNGADDYYVSLNESTMQKILTAHRITSPMMLGIKTAGQLGGRDEVQDAYRLFLNTVVRNFQQAILSAFELIFDQNYDDVTLGIQQLDLYAGDEEDVDVTTSIDSEIGEDSELEAEIEKADEENFEPGSEEADVLPG